VAGWSRGKRYIAPSAGRRGVASKPNTSKEVAGPDLADSPFFLEAAVCNVT